MKFPIITVSGDASANHQPSLIFHSFINKTTHSASSRMYVVLKGQPVKLADLLAQEFRNPLGHIKLSVEMLESLIEDNDMKMYLEVIARNLDRMADLINELSGSTKLNEADRS